MDSSLIEVQHWSGAGNRFVIIDNRTNRIESPSIDLVHQLCQRLTLPPAEGLLLFTQTNEDQSIFYYDFYNPDGSTGIMCGNGARCAVRHALQTTESQRTKINLVLNGRSYQATISDPDRVALRLPSHKDLRWIDRWSYVNVGSDHLVLNARDFLTTLEEFHRFDLISFAEKHLDEYRDRIGIQSLNLNIAYLTDDATLIHLRTYENGVFDETQACGTGAVSTALAFWTRQCLAEPIISILPISGRMLRVEIQNDGLILEGDARPDALPSLFDLKTMKYSD